MSNRSCLHRLTCQNGSPIQALTGLDVTWQIEASALPAARQIVADGGREDDKDGTDVE